MEVPGLGIESELHLSALSTATAMRDGATSATYATACGNTGFLTNLSEARALTSHPHGY